MSGGLGRTESVGQTPRWRLCVRFLAVEAFAIVFLLFVFFAQLATWVIRVAAVVMNREVVGMLSAARDHAAPPSAEERA